jgi:hypothetical protein
MGDGDEAIGEASLRLRSVTALVREQVEVAYLRGLRAGDPSAVVFAVDPHDPDGSRIFAATFGADHLAMMRATPTSEGLARVAYWAAPLQAARFLAARFLTHDRAMRACLARPLGPSYFRAVVILHGHHYLEQTVPPREVVAEWLGAGPDAAGPEAEVRP